VDFVDGIYEEIDASVWCRRVLESFDKFLDANKMGGDEGVSKLEKPQGWDKFPFSQCELNQLRWLCPLITNGSFSHSQE